MPEINRSLLHVRFVKNLNLQYHYELIIALRPMSYKQTLTIFLPVRHLLALVFCKNFMTMKNSLNTYEHLVRQRAICSIH